MASKSENFFTRIKENVMGTKEENRKAQERMDAAAKRKKEKEKEEAEAKTKMAKGGAVKKMAKGGAASKKPVLAIMIGVGKPMTAKKPAAKKKAK